MFFYRFVNKGDRDQLKSGEILASTTEPKKQPKRLSNLETVEYNQLQDILNIHGIVNNL